MIFTAEQAASAAKELGIDFSTCKFTPEEWLAGLNVELEHGTVAPATDITGDDLMATAKIALAHLNTTPAYYNAKNGLEAWKTSLRKGVKSRSKKTEFKTLSFKADAYDEETGVFSGYAAVYGNVDTGGDVIEPGAFTKTIAEGWERVKILALHNDCWLPIGRPLELREDSNGLFIKAKISDTSMGRDIKVLLMDGVLNELSIGYDPIVFEYDESGIRHLREIKLWEVSVVTWAMNPEAVITDYKDDVWEATARAKAMVDDFVSDIKAGRKISAARLKSLEDASSSMKAATKVLDGIISEARGGDKSQKPNQHRAGKAAPKTGTTIEILL